MTNETFHIDKLDAETIRHIFTKIKFGGVNQCWQWVGNKNKRGYGRFRYKGPKILIHRLIYAWLVGPIPIGIDKDIKILDHICNNKSCVNPDHLCLTTHKINVLRGNGPSAREARQTHCKRGHLLPTKKNNQGKRFCQICNSIWARENYRRIHNLTPDKFKV